MGTRGRLGAYNEAVTPEELWRAVGRELRRLRDEQGWTWARVEQEKGPNWQTVRANEDGDIGTVDKLAKHADALGVTIVDVLRSVLASKDFAISPEAVKLVRQFEAMSRDGRDALLNVARVLSASQPTPAKVDQLPPVPPKNKPRNGGSR